MRAAIRPTTLSDVNSSELSTGPGHRPLRVALAFAAVLLGGLAVHVLVFWAAGHLLPPALEQRLAAFDRAVAVGLRGRGSELLDRAAIEVTFLGARLVTGVVLLVATSLLWTMRRRLAVLFLWTSFLGSIVLGTLLKGVFGRPRPAVEHWRIPYATDWSFPSGHALNAIVVYGGLFWVIHRLRPARGLRWTTLILAALAVLLVGASRVYLGVHYPLDVLAGYLAGAGWLVVCGLAVRVAAAHARERRAARGATERGAARVAAERTTEQGEAQGATERDGS